MSKFVFLRSLIPNCMEHVALLLDSIMRRESELTKIDPYLLQVVRVQRYCLNRWGPVMVVSRFLWDVREHHMELYFTDTPPSCDVNLVDSFLYLVKSFNPKFTL